jgi:hypothetical protein
MPQSERRPVRHLEKIILEMARRESLGSRLAFPQVPQQIRVALIRLRAELIRGADLFD